MTSSEHPLNLHAQNYMHGAHEFLKKLREALESEENDLSERSHHDFKRPGFDDQNHPSP